MSFAGGAGAFEISAANWPFKAPVASSGPPPRAGNIQNSPAPRLANTFSQYKPAPNEYRPVGRWPYNYASALRAERGDLLARLLLVAHVLALD